LAVEAGEYEKALELYRGDLVEGLFVREAPEFERWLEDERTRLREKAAGAAWALAHEHIEADRLVDAERTAQRALLLVPTDEDEVRRFIKALADAGDRAAAVRFYEKFAQRLRSEYEIEPDPVTVAVAAALTKGSGQAVAAAPGGRVRPSADMTPISAVSGGIAFMQSRKALIAVLVTAIVILALVTELLLSRSSGGRLDPNRVLVVALSDENGRDEIAMLGRMAHDYIIDVLTDAGFARVVDPLTALAVAQNVAAAGVESGPDRVLALADEGQAGTVVSGNYYAEGDSVLIQTRITDANDGSVIRTIGPVVGSLGAPSEPVGRLGEAVVVALAPLLDQDIESLEPAVQPAAYEAYQAYSEGLEAYMRDDPAEAARHFERATVADPSFHRATLWAAQSYELAAWYAGDWPMMLKGESLIAPLQQSPEQLSRYERCRLGFVIALGRRINISGQYEAARCMVREAPGSDDAKTELANALIRLNRPAEAIAVLRELDPYRGLMKTLPNWNSLNLVRAYHMLGEYEAELEAARQGHQRFPESVGMLTAEARALAALDRLDELPEVLEAMRSLSSPGNLGWQLQWIAEELRVHGHPDRAREVFDEAIAWYRSQPNQTDALRVRWAWALYYAERWDEAQQLFEELAEEHPENRDCLAALGLLAARRGDRAEAARISEQLRSSGNNLSKQNRWYRARIAAVLGQKEQAIALLQQDVDMVPPQDRYLWVHRSIDFESLHDYPPFQEFMRPKR
ncbi:MAG: tetratricopeptide repeat protein, partial [Gemmatimonadota bacterium]